MSQPRIEMNATILPNGKILTVGGSVNDEDATTASLQADLYDTVTNTMGSAGSNAYPRLYHSASLLLPDATVWVAGGNPTRGSYEQHVEIDTPPYLYNSSGFLATRPSITSVTPGVIGYGTSFQVQPPLIMKNGAVIHAFDIDQRLIGLSFTAGSGVLNVTGPPNGNIAPPAYYMIFLINTSGVPSVAKFVQISTTSTDTPAKRTITSPASDILIAPGQSFARTGTASSGSITGYSWSFRGASPATSSLQNPGAVAFANAGTYTASFTVTDSAGNTDPSPTVRTITVATEPAPVLSWRLLMVRASRSDCAPAAMNFYGAPAGARVPFRAADSRGSRVHRNLIAWVDEIRVFNHNCTVSRMNPTKYNEPSSFLTDVDVSICDVSTGFRR